MSTQIRCYYWKLDDDIREVPEQSHSSLSAMSLRRLTPLGKNAFKMLDKCTITENISWVVSCRHGDSDRMVSLLKSLANREILSPSDFSLSVHNAIIGVFSISTKNKNSHTALSAGELSFEAGLIEAYALQKERGGTIGYIYYDKPLPPPYEGHIEGDSPEICFVIILTKEEEPKNILNEDIYLNYLQDDKYVLNSTSSNLLMVMDFIKNDEKECRISVPGGHLHFERVLQEKQLH